jgi:hypothetical protein
MVVWHTIWISVLPMVLFLHCVISAHILWNVGLQSLSLTDQITT